MKIIKFNSLQVAAYITALEKTLDSNENAIEFKIMTQSEFELLCDSFDDKIIVFKSDGRINYELLNSMVNKHQNIQSNMDTLNLDMVSYYHYLIVNPNP